MNFQTLLSGSNTNGNISFVYSLTANNFLYVNSELSTQLKLPNPVTNAAVAALLHQDDIAGLKQALIDLKNDLLNGSIEFRVVVTDTQRCLRLTPFVISEDDSQVVIGNIVDITSEVNNRYSLEKFANKKNSILTMLSHDLRGPLAIGQMIAQSLSNYSADETIVKQSQNLLKIIRQAMDLITDLIRREEADTLNVDLVKRRMDIASKLSEYVDELKCSKDAIHRNIQFSSSDISIYAHLDEAKFMQIVNNLLSNALKFTRNDDTIALHLADNDDTILLTFKDTGVGIPSEYHSELFEKFTPARRKGLNGEPSIGIGLSIVKTIVDWHRGKIWFESKEEEGTTFYVEIPKN